MISRSEYTVDNVLHEYYTYEYDENNNMVKESYYIDGEFWNSYTLFEYDTNNNKIKDFSYKPDGSRKNVCQMG